MCIRDSINAEYGGPPSRSNMPDTQPRTQQPDTGPIADTVQDPGLAPTPVLAVVFDLYNTLIFMTQYNNPWGAVWANIPNLNRRAARVYVMTHNAPPEQLVIDAARAQLPETRLSDLAMDGFLEAVEASATSVQSYPDSEPALRGLRAAGLRLGCCSNLGPPYAGGLVLTGLRELLDEVVFSFEEGAAKGEGPLLYQRTAERMGCPLENILFVGDSVSSDYEGAVQAGMQAVHLDRNNTELSTQRPTIRSLEELLDGRLGTQRDGAQCLKDYS
eukprot:TRINITY_DN12195_c0_g1_i3.p1 TRINITY_DN12195_c0_g1~~TRINITY_DN12195_c0_g1_i3.p1  ORF type:complete len:273 (-),score=69.06 TRINITY_DN12195_c0_g1_i3:379-1197(-)